MFYKYFNPINVSLREFLIILAISFTALWAALVYTKNWRTRYSRLVKFAKKLPGPPTVPLVGNALTFACKPEQLLDRVVDVVKSYEGIKPIRMWMGSALYIVITNPNDIEIILNSQQASNKGYAYKFLIPFLGYGLISGSGNWRSHRKMFAHTLNPRIIRDYIEIFDKHSQILMKKMKNLADGRIFDILYLFEGCTIDIVCESIMGCTDINAQNNLDHDFIHCTAQMYRTVHDRMMKIWLHPDRLFKFTPYHKIQCEAQKVIHRFTEKCIATKRMDLSLSKSNTNDKSSYSINERKSILEQILKINNVTHELSDDELRDEIYTTYIAAQDTMAVTSSFISLMLAIHQDVQTKARQEIQDVLSHDKSINSKSLDQLKYLDMIIKETLRLFPIAPLLVRHLTEDLKLDNCTLPESCQIVILSYATQRSKKYWKNPDSFVPERFSNEETSKRHPYAFIPFSAGQMSCIGQKFAMLSLKTIVTNLLRNYKLTTNTKMQDIKLRTDISIRSINGYKVSLELLS